jgi:hypothetical protein
MNDNGRLILMSSLSAQRVCFLDDISYVIFVIDVYRDFQDTASTLRPKQLFRVWLDVLLMILDRKILR